MRGSYPHNQLADVADRPGARTRAGKRGRARPYVLRFCLLLPLGLSACGLVEPVVCTTEAVPALLVEVRDAATGAPAAANALGRAEDGDFNVALVGADGGPAALNLLGAFERAGTYRITVQKSGYATWQAAGVKVTRDECHVRTVHVRADLQPL